MDSNGIVRQWLQRSELSETIDAEDLPGGGNEDPPSPVSSSFIHDLTFGTGSSIYHNSILPAIDLAEAEVIIVTCFWARSPTLDGLNDTLRKLSAKCVQTQKKIRVRICFSSSSLFQKLFHTTCLEGRTYAPSEWQSQLGLPGADELSGLDFEAKSIFVLPFSVMHPKFVIIDRSKVFFPSCNISWEDWFEGSVQLSGPITEQFVNFWKSFWASDIDRDLSGVSPGKVAESNTSITLTPSLLSSQILNLKDVPSIFLPSSHHRNPQFTLPSQLCPPPPPTPLNTFLMTAFANAKKDIYIQTPNLTSPPVLSALLAALKRGVDVTMVTSERLMILEQLVTAGTTTKRCVRKLIKRHKQLIGEERGADLDSLEAGMRPGALCVKFYRTNPPASGDDSEPVQSHVKLTIVDGEITVPGSGNMDRASWYTSQELGVAFVCRAFASTVRTQADVLMRQRT